MDKLLASYIMFEDNYIAAQGRIGGPYCIVVQGRIEGGTTQGVDSQPQAIEFFSVEKKIL